MLLHSRALGLGVSGPIVCRLSIIILVSVLDIRVLLITRMHVSSCPSPPHLHTFKVAVSTPFQLTALMA